MVVLGLYLVDRIDQFGGIAQLGERLLCKQEVIGSIPFTSTKYSWYLCRFKYVWVRNEKKSFIIVYDDCVLFEIVKKLIYTH